MKKISIVTFITLALAAVAAAQTPDCIRAEPTSIVKKGVYPNTEFRLDADRRTGTETVRLAANDRLTIVNSGCEYYVLKFRFESTRFTNSPTDTVFWYRNAADRLDAISRGLDSSIDLRQAAKKLRQVAGQTKKGKPLKFGRDITFVPGEIRQFMTVDGVVKQGRRGYALEITLAAGPL